MTPPSTPPEHAATTNHWPLILGIAFIICWVGLHLVWAYIFLVGGVVLDLLVAIFKPIFFPGLATGAGQNAANWDWSWKMFAGVIAATSAGVPAGLAFFWREHRGMLLLSFAVLFVIGVLLQVQTCWARLVAAATPPG